jgi:hypothetical protein
VRSPPHSTWRPASRTHRDRPPAPLRRRSPGCSAITRRCGCHPCRARPRRDGGRRLRDHPATPRTPCTLTNDAHLLRSQLTRTFGTATCRGTIACLRLVRVEQSISWRRGVGAIAGRCLE